jgi:hypothetical protein
LGKHPISWIGRLNTVNAAIFLKLIDKFSTIAIGIPDGFFVEIEKTQWKIPV